MPLCRKALDANEISWPKLRTVVAVATPETERQWLDFAAEHTLGELRDEIRKTTAKRAHPYDAAATAGPAVRFPGGYSSEIPEGVYA